MRRMGLCAHLPSEFWASALMEVGRMGRMMTRTMWWTLRLGLGVLCVAGIVDCALGQMAEAVLAQDSPFHIRTGDLPDDIEEALWWLPDNTETILVSRGNVPLAEFRQAQPPEDKDGEPFLAWPQGYRYPKQEYPPEDLVAMYCIEPLVYYRRLYPSDVRHKLINTFYPPKSATLFMKALCWSRDGARQTFDIVKFADNRAARLLEALAALPSMARTSEGLKIVEVNLNQEPSPVLGTRGDQPQVRQEADRRWVAAPRPDVYVCTTSLDLLKVIIARTKQRGSTRALPVSLPEWQYVNPARPTWGLRHYRSATVDKGALSMLKWDPEAVGLVFFGGNGPKPYFALRYLSNSERGSTRILRMQCDWLSIPFESESAHQPPTWRRIDNTCFESRTRINVPRDQLKGSPFNSLPVDATFFFSMDSMYLPWLGFACPRIAFRSQ